MKLTKREKNIIIIAGILFVVFLISKLVVSPIIERTKLLDRLISQKQQDFNEILSLQTDYQKLKEDVNKIHQKISRRRRNFTIFSYLENLAEQSNIKRNLIYMNPRSVNLNEIYKESSVEAKFERITLEQLVKYLHTIQNSGELLEIKRIYAKRRFDKHYLLDVIIQVATFELI